MLNLMNFLDGTTPADDLFSCTSIPSEITTMLGTVVNVIQIGIPIILVILGMLDMGKAVMSQKEDEIKKAQGLFIKRIIYAVVVFLIVAIVTLVLNIIGDSAGDAVSCLKEIFSKKV